MLNPQQFQRPEEKPDVPRLRPERLTGAQMDEISPGWTTRMYERAQRPDGQNG